ncbi:MAG: sigma-70 family RNA polymerase sigma factor [Planctomycetales bacterium]|nr:sigma-70 family RNA polymerase sigma factor [Planctomycetales bacterium]
MSDLTELLQAAQAGDATAADKLLPIIYDDLRRLARHRLAQERDGHSLQATDLVHEAYIRLTGNHELDWSSASHFFGAAAEAMRRILIDRARKRMAQKREGNRQRIELTADMAFDQSDERLVKLDEALDALHEYDGRKANVVKLRFFAGLTNEEVATALGISTATAQRDWQFSRAWLHSRMV